MTLPASFETRRLSARLPIPQDAEGLFSSYTRKPEVSRYMLWRPHLALSQTESFVAECMAAAEARTRMPYVLFERTNLVLPIGMLDARLASDTVDLGYVLAPEFWGRGYMPEAISAVAAFALGAKSFFRVQAFCDVENIPSQRALEKAGFLREGRHERFIVHPNVSPEPRACYMYAKCR